MDPSQFPTLDPELAGLVALLPDMTRSLDDVAGSREFLAQLTAGGGPVPHEDDVDVADLAIPGGDSTVSIRVYRPHGVSSPAPALLYVHGGGFCLGSLDSEHSMVIGLAASLPAVVVSVGYRLAPEHPFPAGLNDCFAAAQWLASEADIDSDRIGILGQSAGAALAAGVTLLARDRGGPRIAFQALAIPVLDDRLTTPSMQAFTATPLWSRPQAEKSWELYLAGAEADQYAAPARAADLSGLPPAYVSTMELDPLRDEGILYAMRLLAAGVSVELHSFPGTFHGSAAMPTAAISKRAAAELRQAIRRGLSVEQES